MKRYTLTIGACAVAAVAAFTLMKNPQTKRASAPEVGESQAIVAVQLPKIAGQAAVGQRIFESACASCHGVNAAGTKGVAPPLVHKIYEPSHHGDEAFQRAVANGATGHHWPFGDMPPIEGLTRGDVAMVVRYVRELQRANGIK
ncbi:c-type cytochrome [Aliiroseovarius lamellibrachiae]|uniref:c-type cytochrome n=1 Tax=Aliiroseovarius lamellibrachiae TaxID=1924933 RepID=UPI001BE0B230|nr:cytochrome c [Aliiroseovarius lamellibrachiae]MBT2131668.1 c-type cytochrome [Aliiroseovarius lamellibrachiae]